jgi:hypothetical protein
LPQLFDDFTRSDMEHANRLEPAYDWWNRSARPEIEGVRRELEEWFSRYPESQAARLAQRFRSTDDDLHGAALFELFVHEQLVRAGLRVECHPALPGMSRSPDFRAVDQNDCATYVEAVCAGPSVAERRAERLKNEAIEVIDTFRSEQFWVSVRVTGNPTGSLPTGKLRLREHIRDWLASLAAMRDVSTAFPFTWKAAGLVVELRAHAKAQQPGIADRLLAVEAGEAFFIPPGNAFIEGALRKKAGRYGSLRLPYFVAINVLDRVVPLENVHEALERVWGTPHSPKYRRVTGVLLARVWNPLAATKTDLKAVLNPSSIYGAPAGFAFPLLDGALR